MKSADLAYIITTTPTFLRLSVLYPLSFTPKHSLCILSCSAICDWWFLWLVNLAFRFHISSKTLFLNFFKIPTLQSIYREVTYYTASAEASKILLAPWPAFSSPSQDPAPWKGAIWNYLLIVWPFHALCSEKMSNFCPSEPQFFIFKMKIKLLS